ncbi:MAG: hypothetical protein M3Q27_05055 [Actinomycetota bacterium]|nr:hypothetical protein [Actinomycetota bacterium]
MTPDDVIEATDHMLEALGPWAQADWTVAAGPLRWDCGTTAVHVASDLLAYAGQVVASPANGYVPFDIAVPEAASLGDVLDVVSACGRLLASSVATADPASRAWHPYGVSDPGGFAAMGVAEVLMQGIWRCSW